MDAQSLYNFLMAHITKCGGLVSEWYAGIATSPEDRLFSDHNVDKANGQWAYEKATNEEEARSAEKMLLFAGCDGGDGGGITPTYVYVYRKTGSTRQ